MRRVEKGFSGRETPLFPTMMVQAQEKMGEGSTNPTDPHHTPIIIQPSTSQPQKKQKPMKPKRKDTEVPQPSSPIDNVVDEAVYEEMDDVLERAATTATSLDAKQDRGSAPRRQETMGDTIDQTGLENVSKTSNDSLLARVSTPQSDEDSIKLKELIEFYTKLQPRVLDLENTKTAQAQEITSLKLREDASKQRRKIDDIDKDAEFTLVDETQRMYGDDLMFDTSDLASEEVFVVEQGVPGSKKDDVVSTAGIATTVSAAATIVLITPEEITLAQALHELKTAKPKVKGIIFKEPVESTIITTLSSQQPSQVKVHDKGKVKMVEPEKPMKKKELIRLDKEIASKLQAEFDEEVRLAREKVKEEQEANVALTEEWDNVQAMIDADYQMAQQMQAKEQEKLSIEEKSKLYGYIICGRGSETRVEGSSKRAREELEQESSKKQKLEDDKEIVKLKRLMEVMRDKEEVALDVIPLAVKSLSIVDWKIHKEGKKSYYQIIRADGHLKCISVSHMLKSFNIKDLETLYKLLKAKYGSTRPAEDLDLVLYGDLKTMFEPHVEDNIWKNQSDYKVLDWKLYDSCGVHSLRKQNVHIHMLVDKRYPFTTPTITNMLNRKLKDDHWNEMCYQLLNLLTKQLKNQ
ncbi:hypothetical protein Tco_0514999 [Tanacetum coccineum]